MKRNIFHLIGLFLKNPKHTLGRLNKGNIKKLIIALRKEPITQVYSNVLKYFGYSSLGSNDENKDEFSVYLTNRTYAQMHQKYLEFSNTSNNRLINGGQSVAIIADLNLPQCKKYRVFQKLEFLNRQDIPVDYSHWQDVPRSLRVMQNATSVIFYRTPASKEMNDYLKEAKRLGQNVFYDIDDPIFDEKVYKKNKNLDYLDSDLKQSVLDGIPLYQEIVRAMPAVIVSTPGMEKIMVDHTGVPCYLWRNLVDSETANAVTCANEMGLTKANSQNSFVINYMSGSLAHAADFDVAQQAIISVLKEYKNVRLRLVGLNQLTKKLVDQFSDQIEVHDFVDYYQYISLYAGSDLNIIPLIQDGFNECKSAIRFYEASLMGVPTICSKIGDFKNFVRHEKNGWIIDNSKWDRQMKKILKMDRNGLKDIGLQAQSDVRSAVSIQSPGENISSELLSLL